MDLAQIKTPSIFLEDEYLQTNLLPLNVLYNFLGRGGSALIKEFRS